MIEQPIVVGQFYQNEQGERLRIKTISIYKGKRMVSYTFGHGTMKKSEEMFRSMLEEGGFTLVE